jgi:hypothetical protein
MGFALAQPILQLLQLQRFSIQSGLALQKAVGVDVDLDAG